MVRLEISTLEKMRLLSDLFSDGVSDLIVDFATVLQVLLDSRCISLLFILVVYLVDPVAKSINLSSLKLLIFFIWLDIFIVLIYLLGLSRLLGLEFLLTLLKLDLGAKCL